jgi:hypothetical protein
LHKNEVPLVHIDDRRNERKMRLPRPGKVVQTSL